MKRQSLLIVNNNMKMGGIQKSLLNLLKEIHNEYNVTLFLFQKQGQYIEEIPSDIEIIEANSAVKYLSISPSELKQSMGKYIVRATLALITKIFGSPFTISLCLLTQKTIGCYDFAISFLHGSRKNMLYGGCNEFVLNKVKANVKIGYIHCDYLSCGINTEHNKSVYSRLDKIAVVSQGCAANFIKALPEIKNKVFLVRNCNNFSEIVQNAHKNPIEYDKNYFNVITVARLSSEKGIERAIEALKVLIKQGYLIKYHIVGDGNMRNTIIKLLHEYHIESNGVLYGNQVNPYIYLKNADLFLLPSYHEAAPMVFDEAKCLGLPILATDTISTEEMIEECSAGWVCENSTEGIQIKLEYILNHINELEEVRENLRKQEFNNKQALQQFRLLVGE